MRTMSARAMVAVVLTAAAVSVGAQQPDMSNVQIKTTKLAPNFYMLEGQGGQIGVLAGPDGVFMVDAQFAPLTEKIVAAVKQISPSPIRFLVNTHVHGDHTGGNVNFGKLGVTLLARDELRARLAKPAPPAGGGPPPAVAPTALHTITYRGPVTLHMNGEEVRLIPVPFAHTDGDTFVRFPVSDVLMTGDVFRSVGYPNIDRNNGGSLKGMLDALNTGIENSGPSTKVLPGHGPVTDRAGLIAHRDMILVVRDRVAAQIKQGRTDKEVVAAKPTADYDAKIAPPGVNANADRFVQQVYLELGGN